MDNRIAAVDRGTIRERAEAALRQAIIEGRLAPGEKLVERELCDALQVSRGSLREALRGLAAEGFVDNVPHRGPSVASISAEQAREIYAVREALEGLAARTLAERQDPHAIASLQQALDRLRRLKRRKADPASMVAVKAEFYCALFDGAGNATLGAIMGTLLARIGVLRRASLSRAGRLPESVDEIAEIVAAIRAGDPDRAERASRLHVRHACLAALPLLANSSHSPTPSRSTN